MPRPRRDSSGSNAGTWLALLGLLAVSGGLLFLAAMVAPHVLGILLVVVGFTSMIAFHYVVWGRWLSKRLQKPEDDEETQQSDPDGSAE